MITVRHDVRPPIADIADLYTRALLRRPVDDLARLQQMYDGSPIVITAWSGDALAGILRGWTDGAFDGYVCDLAVAPEAQKQGVGRRLLDECLAAWPDQVQWVLRASVVATDYYAHLGWTRIENGWDWKRAR
jgi:GNAT superfamily N-acetyltransferase